MTTGRTDGDHLALNEQNGFSYRVIKTDLDPSEQRTHINTLTHNAIFFQLEGELRISWGPHDVTITPGSLYFLPRGVDVSAHIVGKEIKYIAARLDHDINNQTAFIELLKNIEYNEYGAHNFSSLPIREPLKLFIDSIERYILDGACNQQLHNAKLIELYAILRNYYTKEERINLFYPILNKSSKFKTFILDHYHATVSIDELAEKGNMSRSTFDRKFKDNFGMTPHKWLEIQTRILITRKAAEPNVTVKDIMYEVGIYNASQFTKLCKRLCGVAPSMLIRSK